MAWMTTWGSWWLSRLMMALRQSLGPVVTAWTRSQRSMMRPQSSVVFFPSVTRSEKFRFRLRDLLFENTCNDNSYDQVSFFTTYFGHKITVKKVLSAITKSRDDFYDDGTNNQNTTNASECCGTFCLRHWRWNKISLLFIHDNFVQASLIFWSKAQVRSQ